MDKQTAFEGNWGRPQTDGPPLRASTLIKFAEVLIENGEMDYVKKFLWTGNEEDELHGGVIRWDLEWIVNNWQAKGFDLWEEIESTDFFWNRMAFKFVLDQGQVFAKKMGDEELVETYKICAQTIHITLNNHWNGEFMHQCEQRPKDSAVIHAFVSFPGVYNALD